MADKEMKNEISVICPTYNSSAYIQRTINCLLSQTMLPREIIFSDDGSNDKTVKIIEGNRRQFEKKGVVLIIIENSHSGPGAARNSAINATNRNWIAFLDSDDIWGNNKISQIQKSIIDNPEANCFLHWEEYNRINRKPVILRHGDKYFKSDKPVLGQLYMKNFLSTSALVCENSLIKNVGGFDITLPNAQDYDLWLKMANKMRLKIIPLVLGEYTEQSNSITSRPYYKRIWAEIRIAFRYKNQVPVSTFLYKTLKIVFSIQWLYTLHNLLTGNQRHGI